VRQRGQSLVEPRNNRHSRLPSEEIHDVSA
jgi:hypothetical protein